MGIGYGWERLGRMLPALVTVLLLLMVTAVVAMSYRELRQALLEAAGERVCGDARHVR